MSYTFLLEGGAESSAECFSGIPQCALSRSSLPVDAICSRGSETESSRGSRSGMMFAPLTEGHGEVESMSFAEGSRVRTSPLPERGLGSTESDPGFGPKCVESLARYDRASRSWRTRQRSLFMTPSCNAAEGLIEFSETWPSWGTTVAGELFLLQTPSILVELRHLITCEIESGSTQRLPTAYGFSKDGKSNGPSGNELGRAVNRTLRVPTPCATDGRKWNRKTRQQRKDQGSSVRLCNMESEPGVPIGGSLNPDWVEWLMGWPIGWTDSRPLEMDRFQQWLLLHGDFFPVSNL